VRERCLLGSVRAGAGNRLRYSTIIRSPVRASILPDCPLHKSPFRPVAMCNSPIASGVTEDNPQGHSTTETIPAFCYRFDFLTERVLDLRESMVRRLAQFASYCEP